MASTTGPRPRFDSPGAFVQGMINEIDELLETAGKTDTQRLVRDLPLELDAFRAKFEAVKRSVPSDWDAFLEDVENTDEASRIQGDVTDFRDTVDAYMRLLGSVITAQTLRTAPSSYQIRQDRLAAEAMLPRNDYGLAGASSWANAALNTVQSTALSVAAGDLPVDYETCNKVLWTAKYAKEHAEKIKTFSQRAGFDEKTYTNIEDEIDSDTKLAKLALKDAMNQRFICLHSTVQILNETVKNDSVSLKKAWIEDRKAPLFVNHCLNIEWSMGPRRNRLAHAYGVPNMVIPEKYQAFDPRDHWNHVWAIYEDLINALDEVIETIRPMHEKALWQKRNEDGYWVDGENIDPWTQSRSEGAGSQNAN
ncbi:uncharacterized protein BDZ99DRAFT_528500 [Mytilinidion resinicola]|uniref:Uncharacterized protein n=1 Tax=Mytilinidion resinicola TaxID=574789 RepID=A0A6A6XY89_9PEZI|nr:uncharacterized protein BDZ99DRAFT_528500 [Mytilinidion resinicola]KAF2801390.1 hypothetical protein BDZ99DRAFT_528500 [Mytilinidion resinicola]